MTFDDYDIFADGFYRISFSHHPGTSTASGMSPQGRLAGFLVLLLGSFLKIPWFISLFFINFPGVVSFSQTLTCSCQKLDCITILGWSSAHFHKDIYIYNNWIHYVIYPYIYMYISIFIMLYNVIYVYIMLIFSLGYI